MSNLPSVIIFGRMNVGKSTLFNRLAKREKSIVMDYSGVTRDFISDQVAWYGVSFIFTDTGGVSIHKSEDPLTEQVRLRALQCAREASVVLFVVDGTVGITLSDQELAKWLHKNAKEVILIVNKIDVHVTQERLHEFDRLGFKRIITVSATHGTGIELLQDSVIALLPHKAGESVAAQPVMNVVFLGKPNVGKSSLMNMLLQEERSIVSDIPGTTREAVTAPLQFYAQTIALTDTAGVRRKRSVSEPLEELMVKSSMQAVRQSDIALLLVDASQGRLSDQELKLAFYVFEQGKALIIVLNKEDLMDVQAKESWKFHRDEYKFLYDKLEVRFISCKSGKNVNKLLSLITKVWQRYHTKLSDSQLTSTCKQALMHRPLYRQGQLIRLYRVEQIKTAPPTIKLVVSNEKLVGEREQAYLEHVLRKAYDLLSIPVCFVAETFSERY